MSMNRCVGLGVFALMSSVFLGLACDDSATPPVTSSPGAGGATTKKTSAVKEDGGEGSGEDGTGGTTAKKSTSKASTAKGGSSSSSAKKTTAAKPDGGSSGEDTEPAATGGKSSGGTPTAECELGTTNLLDDAAKSETFSWVGGDNTIADDDPCGFQGAFYAYSDKGADETAGNADDSLQKPAFKSGSEYESPCVEGKCCISGTTSLWPAKDVYTTWGAGLGFSLSDAGDGAGKRAYAGSARGFRISFSNKMAKQMLRIGLTQSETDESAPFVSMAGFSGEKDVEVKFADPTCPTWASACIDPTDAPYDLQIQVAGGDSGADGDFEVCVTKLVPIE